MTITRKKSSVLNDEAATTAAIETIEDYGRANRERIVRRQHPNQTVATMAQRQRTEAIAAAISIESKIAGRPTGKRTVRPRYLR